MAGRGQAARHGPAADVPPGYGREHVATYGRSDQGLPTAVAVLLLLGMSVLGAGLDGLLRHDIGPLFAVGFALGSALGALLVRRAHVLSAVVAPPLVYASLAVADHVAGGVPRTVVRQGVELVTSLVQGAPVLLLGTVLAGLVALVRSRR